jgi:hypothetical protein
VIAERQRRWSRASGSDAQAARARAAAVDRRWTRARAPVGDVVDERTIVVNE